MYFSTQELLKSALIDGQRNPKIASYLLFVAAENHPDKASFEEILALNEKPLLGGIFPEIIGEGIRYKTGFALVPLEERLQVACFESQQGIVSPEAFRHWLEEQPVEAASVFCFVNAFWSEKTTFLHALYDVFGPFVNYLGGGAGSLSFKSFPCILSNQRVIERGAVIGLMDETVQLGVAHGWQPISDPIKVTQTKGNTIVSLNWKPAFEVYRELIEAHSQQRISPENFFDIARSYPLGLVRLDDEMIIRDPYATEAGMLHIVDEVPEGEYIRIMHGDLHSLLKGAREAVSSAFNGQTAEGNQVCFDCISRVLFMQSDFQQELTFLNQNHPMDGALSVGEIANIGSASLELFNKTVVVARWKKTN
ncbi:FIST signal transduction protein [Cyclobacterium xiamenense]|uniref:FIST signal transduction protein n=1 Tax=Cyclobacterium xiamenense TaxID=1297121 RepID=UPI0012B7BC6F|nr:FIST C-terminal domain-containing protein [Cyclobacterium xiamenense]